MVKGSRQIRLVKPKVFQKIRISLLIVEITIRSALLCFINKITQPILVLRLFHDVPIHQYRKTFIPLVKLAFVVVTLLKQIFEVL